MPNFPLGPDGQPISDIVPFPLSGVPEVLTCPCCGCYVKDLSMESGFEVIVARALKAKNASQKTEGYDSELFPGYTFQVKCAQARCTAPETRKVNGRTCAFKEHWTWTWHEHITGGTDFYILFGVKDDLVYPFFLTESEWLGNSSKVKATGAQIRITTCNEYSPCGRYASSFKRNRFWEFALSSWPDSLLERLNASTQ